MRKLLLILIASISLASSLAQSPMYMMTVKKVVAASGGLQDLNFTLTNGLTNPSAGVWGGTSGTFYGNYSLGDKILPSGVDGHIESQYATTDDNRCILAFSTSNTVTIWNVSPAFTCAAFIYDGVLNFIDNSASPSSTGYTMSIGDYYRITRTGSITKLQSSTNHTTWTDRQTYSTTSTADFYTNVNMDVTAIPAAKIHYPKIYTPPSFGKIIVADGNSLTYGDHASNQATTSYPAVMATNPSLVAVNAVVYNKGVNGQTTQQMIADAATDIDPLYSASVRSIVVCWEGGNDFYFNNIIADSVYAHIVRYCTERRAVGWKVVVVTIPYRDASVFAGGVASSGITDANYDIERLAVNALIMANYPTFADAVADLANQTGFTSYQNPPMYLDHIHYEDPGYATIAAFIGSVVNTVN